MMMERAAVVNATRVARRLLQRIRRRSEAIGGNMIGTGVHAARHVAMKTLQIKNLDKKDLETKSLPTKRAFAAMRPCGQKKSRAQKSPA
jgi:hypothetical protein